MKNDVAKVFDALLTKTKKYANDCVHKFSANIIENKRREFINFYNERNFIKCARIFSYISLNGSIFEEFFIIHCFESSYTTKEEFTRLLYYSHMNGGHLIRMLKFNDLLRFFENAEKPYLPMEKSKEIYNSTGEEFEIYRGSVNFDKEKAKYGLCWSLNARTAETFTIQQNTDSRDRVIFKGIVKKSDIFAILCAYRESEIVVNPYKVKIIEETFLPDKLRESFVNNSLY